MDAFETERYNGYTVELHYDLDPSNPREDYEEASTMVCFHRHYTLGDTDHGYDSDNYESWSGLAAAIESDNPGAVMLPLYLMDHSGISMSTGSFNDPWDSGQVGFIFMSEAQIRECYLKGDAPITDDDRAKARELMQGEVKTYDAYLTGAVCGFVVENSRGDLIESCWGFYSDEDAMLEGKSAVDAHIAWLDQELDDVRDVGKAIALAGQLP